MHQIGAILVPLQKKIVIHYPSTKKDTTNNDLTVYIKTNDTNDNKHYRIMFCIAFCDIETSNFRTLLLYYKLHVGIFPSPTIIQGATAPDGRKNCLDFDLEVLQAKDFEQTKSLAACCFLTSLYNTMIMTSAVLNNPNRNFTFLHHLGIFNFDLAPPNPTSPFYFSDSLLHASASSVLFLNNVIIR